MCVVFFSGLKEKEHTHGDSVNRVANLLEPGFCICNQLSATEVDNCYHSLKTVILEKSWR